MGSVNEQKLAPLSHAVGAVRWAKDALKMYGLANHPCRHRLTRHLAQMYMALEYMDNFAITKVGDEVHTKIYLESREKGCCGRYDTMLDLGDDLFLVGCNYGH